MFKKIICIFLCLIFLLSISCVVADENISDYPSLPDDIGVMEECSEIDGAEIDGESFDDSYDEYDISKVDQSVELNTTGIVMSDDEYSCGAASFATVANNLGINISLDEAKTAVNTTINGTTMEGILNGASKYKLYATGIYINSTELKENYIVHMVATYYAYKEYKSWKYYLHDWTFKKGSWKNC